MPDAQTVILIAHQRMLPQLAKLLGKRRDAFAAYRLLSLKETAEALQTALDVEVAQVFSARNGGEIQLCGLVCSNTIRAVFFLRDPLNQDPTEPDIAPFYRACDLNNVPMATNMVGAVALSYWLGRKSDGDD